jgi:23S rRNA (cytidine1920-2'-O)/16S rRNA (cytidine1409-2'-O)-methyltransferase
MRADQLLVERGLAASRAQAQRLIGAGVEWRLSPMLPWRKVTKNGEELAQGTELRLLDAAEARYVSRGGLKLEGALRQVSLSVQGTQCLDVGQSTGGFTDCLLQQGAARVVGVDVGRDQLHERLRKDLRVTCLEGLNARFLTPATLAQAWDLAMSEVVKDEEDNETQPQAPYAWMRNGGEIGDDYDDSNDAKEHEIEAFKSQRAVRAKAVAEGVLPEQRRRRSELIDVQINPVFQLITGDLSFISLTLVLPALVPLLANGGHILMLVKPQFELQPSQVGKGGIVRDPAFYLQVEQKLRAACASLGLLVLAWCDSSITGGDGNREFFIFASKS